MPRQLIEPQSYQRRWREYNVDKNLKDEWLVAINNLNNLNVVSTCEGHNFNRRRSSCPHVNLRLKRLDDYCPVDELHINYFKDLLKEIDTSFFRVSLELYMRVTTRTSNTNRLVFSFDSTIQNTQENNTLINEWWDELIKTLIKIDSILEIKKLTHPKG